MKAGDAWNGFEWVSPERYEAQRVAGVLTPDGQPLPPLQDSAHTASVGPGFRGFRPGEVFGKIEIGPPETVPVQYVEEQHARHIPMTEQVVEGFVTGAVPGTLRLNDVHVPDCNRVNIECAADFTGKLAPPSSWRHERLSYHLGEMLHFLDDNSERGGLEETPSRAAKAWVEWTSGYGADPAAILKVFEDGAEDCDEMVVVRDIPVYSHCEHHLAPIFGTATVGYLPNGKIVGLSKLPRLVEIFMRRLQVQERMTNQIATAIMDNLMPHGCGVVITARHMCMESRGVQLAGTTTVTSALRGLFRTDTRVRAEFLALAHNGGK